MRQRRRGRRRGVCAERRESEALRREDGGELGEGGG